MSKTLTITWDNVIPSPDCGYAVQYRRNYDPSYTTLSTSGSTSGTTTLSTIVAAPACFEGRVYSDCCGDTVSLPETFGINTEVPFAFGVAVVASVPSPSGYAYELTVSSEYPNPYDTLISGTFDSTAGGGTTVPFQVTYPASSTTYSELVQGPYPTSGDTTSNIIITAVNSIFNQGGDIQQLDPISTPPYFSFFWDGTTGTTWNGSPMSLPSSILANWTVTEVSETLEPTAGILDVSWIYDSIFGGGVYPYDFVRLKVFDANNNELGLAANLPQPLGLWTTQIYLVRADPNYPLLPGQPFTMTAIWADDSIADTRTFFLPSP